MRFVQNDIHFACRTAGIILHNHHMLLQGEPQEIFWTLPGGSIELQESSQQALVREMQEELGIAIHIERLLWMVEHFFTIEQQAHHELGFYYLVTPLADPQFYDLAQTIYAIDGEHGEVAIIFRWFNLDELTKITLYPSFLPTTLQSLPLTPEHITFVED